MMNYDKLILISEIKCLSNILDKQYDNEFSFRNHCYLRTAFDVTIDDKWYNKLAKPFVNYASEIKLKNVLITDNKKSLAFRKKIKKYNCYKTLNYFDLTLFNSSKVTYSNAFMLVASKIIGGATPASSASFQRSAHKHQTFPTFKPKKPFAGKGKIKLFPLAYECFKILSVTTTTTT